MNEPLPSTAHGDASGSSVTKARRLRVGVVLDDMDGEYHEPLLDGICRTAERLDIDLVCAPG